MVQNLNLRNQRVFEFREDAIQKTADVDLGGDPQTWFGTVLGIFRTQHPELSGSQFSVSLKFTKQDLVEGYASGTITVSGGPHLLEFPVIIRDGQLVPFDLVFIDNELRYADPGLISAYASPYRPALGLTDQAISGAPDTSDALHVDKIMPGMRTVIASVDYPDLAKIAATLDNDQKSDLIEWLRSNPARWMTATPQFKQAAQVLLGSVESKDEPVDHLKQAWHDRALVYRRSIGSYDIFLGKFAHSNIAHIENANATQIRKLAGAYGYSNPDSLLDRIDRVGDNLGLPTQLVRGGDFNTKTAADTTAYTLEQAMRHTASPDEVNSYGSYEVYFKDKGPQTALVLPVVDWDFKRTQTKLVISDDTFAVTERVLGKPAARTVKLPASNISRGAWGAFVHQSSDRSFSTMPFEVIAIRDTPAGFAIVGIDVISNTKLNLVKVPGITSITKMNPKVDPVMYLHGHVNAYIPSAMEFVQLPMMNDTLASNPTSIFKSASFDNALTLSNGRAWRDRDSLAKLASIQTAHLPERRMMSDVETLMTLSVSGLYSDKLAYSIITGSIPSHLTLALPGLPEPEEAKIASVESYHDEVMLERAARAVKAVIKHAPFMKIAASTQDGKELGSILAINMVNERNMKYFMDNIGVLRECEAYLARLLLMTRISAVGVNEADLKAALDSLVDIKNTLSRLGMLREE